MKKDSPIFVAGHRGLVGSAFIRRLKQDGFGSVSVRTKQEVDLTRQEAVESLFREIRPQLIIMAAGKVGGIMTNSMFPADFITENLCIQNNIFRASLKYDAVKVLFFGSSCMYPKVCSQPMREEFLLTGEPEETSLSYAVAKLAGIQMCRAFNEQFNFRKFIPVIPNTIFGPHDNFDPIGSHVIPAMLRKFHEARENQAKSVTMWGSGTVRRESVYVDDVVEACITLLSKDDNELPDFPINIGVGHDHSVREMTSTISSVAGFEGSVEWDRSKPDGAPRKLLDNSRILSAGWYPKVSFLQGIEKTYEWYLKTL